MRDRNKGTVETQRCLQTPEDSWAVVKSGHSPSRVYREYHSNKAWSVRSDENFWNRSQQAPRGGRRASQRTCHRRPIGCQVRVGSAEAAPQAWRPSFHFIRPRSCSLAAAVTPWSTRSNLEATYERRHQLPQSCPEKNKRPRRRRV